MAESGDGQEREEKPTPRRMQQAHDDGQVPRSQELSAAVITLAGAAALATFAGSTLGSNAINTMTEMGGRLSTGVLTENAAADLLRELIGRSVLALVPFLLALLVPVVLIGAVQAQGVFSFKPITPDISRISPVGGIKRLFSVQSLFTLLKSLLKLLVIGVIAWLALRASWPTITAMTGADAGAVLVVARSTMARFVLITGVAFLLVAALDYGFTVWKHQRDLRMSRQELIQEYRETEGNPLVKSRIRSLAQALARRRMLAGVKTADVVIVNPTEIAVALRYDAEQASAPVVVAMGRRKLAERIRSLAGEAGVPVVRNVPVARALIATGKVGQPIPAALYAAVAEVLAFVYRQRGRIPGALTETGVR